MTTAKKLSLGFGILTALLVLFSIALTIRLRSIENNVDQQANVARIRADETRQMEINVLAFALAVNTFEQNRNIEFKELAAREASNVDEHLSKYRRLAITELELELANGFETRWQQFRQVGEIVIESSASPPTPDIQTKLTDFRTELERFLDDEMQPEAASTFAARLGATREDITAISTLATILLAAFLIIAVMTGTIVGRNIVYTERLIEENRELLRTTLASIGDAVMTTDNKGNVTFLNTVAQTLTGWTQTDAEGMAAGRVFNIINESTRLPVESPIDNVLRDGKTVALANHTILLTKDGREVPIDDSGAPIRDKSGTLSGVVLVFRDITVRKEAEKDLRESELRLRSMADSIPQLAWMAEPDGFIFWYNWKWYEYTGATPEQMEGWGWQSVHDTEILPRVLDRWKKSIELGEPFEMEFPLRRADGVFRWFLTRVNPVRDSGGKIVRWFGTNTDIDESRRNNEALRQSEEQFRNLFNSIDEGFCNIEVLFDEKSNPVDYRFLNYNPAFEKLTGLGDVVGKRVLEVLPDLERFWIETYGKVALTGESIRFENNSEPMSRWFDVYASRVGGSESRKVAIVFNNITERKLLDLELRKSRKELSARVMERTSELAEANRILRAESVKLLEIEKERVRLLNQLITTQEDERRRIARDLHDELGQQMTALRLKLENAKDICEDEAVCGEIDEIQLIAQRLDTDVSFLARELRPAALEDTGLADALSNYIKEWSRISSITAEFHATGFGSLRLDPEIEGNLYRIAQEALNNTRKHSKAKNVSVLLTNGNNEITLIVEDDGIAFNPESKPSRRKGLGLVGMQERTALLGGKLEIESTPETGTTIFVKIPMLRESAKENFDGK